MGKCVAWDTPIVDASDGLGADRPGGLRARAGGPPGTRLALDDDLRARSIAPSAFVDDGVKPVYKITTRTGRAVRTTITHPFLTADGWKPSPTSRRRPCRRASFDRSVRRRTAPRSEVVMLGFLIGNGCLADGSPMMSTGSPSVLLELQRCAAKLGVTVRHLPVRAPPLHAAGAARARSPPCCASTPVSGRRSRGPSTS